jgi:ribA/ribD-fused uncharacterized protein
MPRKPRKTILLESGILLNFARTPFWLPHPAKPELFEYQGVEWRFQAIKCLCGTSTNIGFAHDNIANAFYAREAKQLGRKLRINLPAWEAISWHCMMEACLAKYSQHNGARVTLVSTGTAKLVEHRPDPIWGDNMDGTGKNLLGKILMEVRAVLK